ncbi:MAG: ABC transporter substrate-binding protein, partial [Ignavibacteria bacterium]|nr:ABC transporter substrate-binding protein [Ignavibacteria bacterium]
MKSTKKIILVLAIAILAIGGIFYFLQKPSEPNKVTVRLKWLHQAQFAGFYYAKEAGFYKDAGINVTINPGGVDFPAVQMVSAGSEQFGVTAADQLLLAREKGIPVVCLAVIYRKSPVVYFAKTSSGIKTPKDFIGKKVGVKLG